MNAADAIFPEVRGMLDAGRRYLRNEIGLVELHGFVAQCRQTAKLFSAHPSIVALANEWSHMVNATWNEWGIDPNPIPVTEFRIWLQQQIDCYALPNDNNRA